MSVWKCKDRDGYKWEFQKDSLPYFGYTDTRQEAVDAEAEQRSKLKDAKAAAAQAAITPDQPSFLCPTIMEWAGIYLTDEEKRINGKANWTDRKKKDRIAERQNMLTVLLRFFGARPEKEKPVRDTVTRKDLRPYHNLRLDDPIKHGKWLLEFDAHMDARGLDPNTKNNQQSAMSMLYKHALKTKLRLRSGISVNPFRDLERGEARRRTKTLTDDEFMRIYRSAAPHLQFALDIGAYAYALRVGSILRLTTDDMDEKMTRFTVWDHKTNKNGTPITVPIAKALRPILKHNLQDPERNPECKFLIQAVAPTGPKKGTMDGIRKIHSAVQGAVERAGFVYGRAGDGITFHTIRHWMNTEAAQKGIAKERRKDMGGHASDAASDWYTHFDAETHRADLNKVTDAIAKRRAIWEKKWAKSFQNPSKVLPKAGISKRLPKKQSA